MHDWLIETLFAYDVIGFQTDTDVHNFQRYVAESMRRQGAERRAGDRAFGRTVIAARLPDRHRRR